MPVIERLTAIEEIIRSDQGAKILVLASFLDDEMVISAARKGATGILFKDTPTEQLFNAMRAVYRGESTLHPTIASKLMKQVQQTMY